MAHYDVTYTCGHSARVNLIGPHRVRERRLERLRQDCCRDCWLAREHAAAQARTAAENWPAWTAGTPAQQRWAESIRAHLLDSLDTVYQDKRQRIESDARAEQEDPSVTSANLERLAAVYAAGRASLIEERTDAKWWIDHRDDGIGARFFEITLRQGLSARPELAPQAAAPVSPQASTPPPPPPPSLILRPDQPLTETIATVVYEPDKQRLAVRFSEYSEPLRQLMRELEFSWIDCAWVRNLAALAQSERTIPDRLAETATRLVAAGFVARLRDAAAYELAQAGTFKPERRRWVRAITDTTSQYAGWLTLAWPQSDDLYTAANRLRGARWRAGRMLVPPGSVDEIEEFARTYDFAISEKAQAVLDEVHESQAHGMVLTPSKSAARAKRRKSGDGAVPAGQVPPVLPVPDDLEVADALRDDD